MENLVKTRPAQKFWPLHKPILPPLEQRSRCGSDMCVKTNCASPTRSLTTRHCSSSESLLALLLYLIQLTVYYRLYYN